MDEHEIICRQFVELVTDYLEEALPPETVDLVEQHLVMCDWCRDYLGQFGAVGDLEAEPPPKEMLESLLVAFRAQAWEDT